MSNRVFSILPDQTAQEMTESFFLLEEELQEIVEKNPDLLAREWDTQPRKLYLIQREQIAHASEDEGNSYSLDHLLVDSEAVPILVEVKRSSDTRIRREVVAQMMDYACRAHSWKTEDLRESFIENNTGNDAAEEIYQNDDFWNRVSANLESEHFRLVFVADRIPDTLRILIEFLDRSMRSIEVYGVELKPYQNAASKMVVASIVGNSLENQTKPTYSDRQAITWTHELFMDRLQEMAGEKGVEIAERLIAFSKTIGLDIVYGRGAKKATLTPKKNGATVFGIVQSTQGSFVIEFYDEYLEKLGHSFAEVLAEIQRICMPERYTSHSIWIDLLNLGNADTMEQFQRLLQSLAVDND